MRDTTQLVTSPRRNAKLASAEFETMKRRRVEQWRVLGAITELLPGSADTDGRAVGTLSVAELAAHAGVSNKAVDRALYHWREWRILGLFWKGDQVWDVRFERAVIESLLTAWTITPREVSRLLIEHRRWREAMAPRRVPKTLGAVPLQSVESVEAVGGR